MISFLSLGTNMGNKQQNLLKALDLLNSSPGIKVDRVSGYYETEPWGGVEQEAFINIAVKIETSLDPYKLLNRCQEIENIIGRKKLIHWGPREIDIDILTYDDLKLSCENLKIPHPYMEEREFVLAPLREIAPDFILPSGTHIKDKVGKGVVKNYSGK